MYIHVYCVYTAMLKNPKTTSKFSGKSEPSVILIVFNSVLYRISSYTFLTVTLHGSGTRKVLLGPWLNNTDIYLNIFISTGNHTIAVSDWCLTPSEQFFSHSMARTCFQLMDWWFFIVLPHRNSSPRIDMSFYSDAFSWFRALCSHSLVLRA